MSNNAGEILVAGTGSIFIAPVGTALPTTEATALNASFVELGYTTDDGVKFTVGQSTQEIPAWQSKGPVRRFITERSFMSAFELLQWNAETMQVAFGGGTVSAVSPGHFRYDFPADSDALAEYAAIIQWVDGPKATRLVIPRNTLNDNTEVTLSAKKAGTLPVSLKALQATDGKSAYILSNDPQLSQLS